MGEDPEAAGKGLGVHVRTIVQVALLPAMLTTMLATGTLAQDISGTWQAFLTLDVGSGELTFVFKQDGEQLTGTYEGTFGSAEVTGTVQGTAVEFSFEVQGGVAAYTGTVSDDTMKGTCDYGQVGGGTWEAERLE